VGRIQTAVLVSVGSVLVFIGLTLLMMGTSEPFKFPKWYELAILELLLGLLLPLPIAIILNMHDWFKARRSQ